MVNWINTECLTDYEIIVQEMELLAQKLIEKKESDTIILTEHSDVVTFGSSAKPSDLLFQTNIPVIETGRGGKYTYHGPGQRIIYPVLDLRIAPWNQDLKKYVVFLHDWIIATLAKIGVESFCHNDHIGIWVNKNGQKAKIAAIGIRARKWVAFHGAAVNISTDLSKFQSFIPCGISNLGVTSLSDIGINISLEEFDEILKKEYYSMLNSRK